MFKDFFVVALTVECAWEGGRVCDNKTDEFFKVQRLLERFITYKLHQIKLSTNPIMFFTGKRYHSSLLLCYPTIKNK